METTASFEFKECISILKATGKKASTLRELRNYMEIVPDSCIFHHTYQYFLKGRIMEYTNDFAQWAGEDLEERALSEQLSSIDLYGFKDINILRREILRVIDVYLELFPEPRAVLPGQEFYFNDTVTIIACNGMKANNLAEFLVAVRFSEPASIYFHFYEARMHFGEGIDDFSIWLESAGRKGAAQKIREIDPFMYNIEGIRSYIAGIIEEEVKLSIELN